MTISFGLITFKWRYTWGLSGGGIQLPIIGLTLYSLSQGPSLWKITLPVYKTNVLAINQNNSLVLFLYVPQYAINGTSATKRACAPPSTNVGKKWFEF